MSNAIDHLPEDLKEQVGDYINFLLDRYGSDSPPLTAEQKTRLDERWDTYQQRMAGTRESLPLPLKHTGVEKERDEPSRQQVR